MHSLQQTAGDDLAKLLLLKSPSSEVWFDRRTNFTRYPSIQGYNVRKVNYGCVYSAYILKPVLSGRNL